MPRRAKKKVRPITKADGELGMRIAALRKARGLSQIKVAKTLGRKQRMFSYYEQGLIRVPASDIPKLAAILKVSVTELLGLKQSANGSRRSKELLKMLERVEELPPKKQRQVTEYIELLAKAS